MIGRAMNALALLGSEWVLWLLIFLSVSSVAVMIERAIFFARRSGVDGKALADQLISKLRVGDLSGAKALLSADTMEAHVIRQGLEHLTAGANTVRELMA